VIAALRSALPLLPRDQRARLQAQIDRAQVRVAELQRQADRAAGDAAAAAEAQAASLQRSLQAATAAQRGQAELALELARDQQARLTLRAPLAGTVQLGRSGGGGTALPDLQGLPEGAEQALQGLGGSTQPAPSGPPLRVGSEVAAGQTVATVFDVSGLLVAAEVDETDIALVRPGQRARVELDAFPQAAFGARVRRVAVAPTSAQSTAGGVTYQVDLALGDPEPGAAGETRPVPRVGMTATAAIEVRRATEALSVPGSALVGRAGGQAVFVVEDGKVRLRPIQVAADGEDRVAVASGLREGERVVSRGAERLRDGQDWPGD
jgi:multidrug efflux pump subunit AcrA (membrane-fusion protein)